MQKKSFRLTYFSIRIHEFITAKSNTSQRLNKIYMVTYVATLRYQHVTFTPASETYLERLFSITLKT